MLNNIIVTSLLVLLAPVVIVAVVALIIPSLVFTSLWNLVMPVLDIGLPQVTVVQGFASVSIACVTVGLIRGFVKLVNLAHKEQIESEKPLSSILDSLKQSIHNEVESVKNAVSAPSVSLKPSVAFLRSPSPYRVYHRALSQIGKRIKLKNI